MELMINSAECWVRWCGFEVICIDTIENGWYDYILIASQLDGWRCGMMEVLSSLNVESISTLPVKGEESLDNFNQKKER